MDIEKLMLSHNLRGLYDAIHQQEQTFCLDRGSLSMLKDFYLDAKYNFVTVSKQECQDCLNTMYDVLEQTYLENVMDYKLLISKE